MKYFSGGLIIPPIVPPALSGELIAFDAEALTTADQSGQGNIVTEVGGAPIFAPSARFADFVTMNFSIGKCLTTTGPCTAYRIGADKPWTQVLVWRTNSVGTTQQLMGWANQTGASDKVHITIGQTGAPRRYQNILRDDASASTTVNSTSLWNAAPELLIVVCDGTHITFYKNNLADGTALQDRGVLTPNSYNFMCRNAFSGLDASGNGDILNHHVYNRALSPGEMTQWAQYVFDKYGMSASGAIGPGQKVGLIIGQSNARLAGTATLSKGFKVRDYTLDQFWRLNPEFSQSDIAPVFNGVFAEGTGKSVNWGLFACDQMAADTIFNYGLITNAKGSTGTGGAAGPASATNWYPSTDTDTLYGAALNTINKAALLSSATPKFALIDIGEQDSKSAVSPWTIVPIYNDLRGRWPGIVIIIRRLRATNPNPGTYLSWAGTRANELAAHNPPDNVYVVDSSDDPADYIADGVHMNMAYQEEFGRTVIAPLLAPLI